MTSLLHRAFSLAALQNQTAGSNHAAMLTLLLLLCCAVLQYSSQALGGLVDYSDITFGKYLGDGSFGSVHLARWKHVQAREP